MSWFYVILAVITLLQVLEAYWQHQENKALREWSEDYASANRSDELDQRMLL